MARPTLTPDWNTGGANNTEPSAQKKIDGWAVGEKPPAQYFNWWQKLVYTWIVWLASFDFDATITAPGTAGDTNPVFNSDGLSSPTDYKLLWRWNLGTIKGRLYVSKSTGSGNFAGQSKNGLILTVNAAWNGTQWAKDVTNQEAARYEFATSNNAHLRLATVQAGTAGPFNDTAWGSGAGNKLITIEQPQSVLAYRSDESWIVTRESFAAAPVSFGGASGAASQTRYLHVGGPALAPEAVEADASIACPVDGVISSLRVKAASFTNGGNLTFTIRKNGADTTWTAAGSFSGGWVTATPPGAMVTVSKGDLLTVKVVSDGGTGAIGKMWATFEISAF